MITLMTASKKQEQSMNILYLANSGVVFRRKNYQVVVDGLFNSDNPFSPPDEAFEQTPEDYIGDFDGETVLAFTHCHSDHFDIEKVERMMRRHSGIRCAYVPGFITNKEKIRRDGLDEMICCFTENEKTIWFGGFYIAFSSTRHIPLSPDESKACCAHCCICIQADGQRWMLAGDAYPDFCTGGIGALVRGNDGVFLNPVFLGKRVWANQLRRESCKVPIYIYHLPDERKDTFLYRQTALRNYDRYMDRDPHLTLLTEPMTNIAAPNYTNYKHNRNY